MLAAPTYTKDTALRVWLLNKIPISFQCNSHSLDTQQKILSEGLAARDKDPAPLCILMNRKFPNMEVGEWEWKKLKGILTDVTIVIMEPGEAEFLHKIPIMFGNSELQGQKEL